MSKIHIFGAFLMLAAWSGNVSLSNPSANSSNPSASIASRFQIGSAANAEVRWTPNPDRGSASSTLSGGRRGTAAACALDNGVPEPAITLLVPDNSKALTTEAQPTLSWYIESAQAVDMEFILSHPEHADPVYTKRLRSDTGLVEVALPEIAALEADTEYWWTVFVDCDSDGEYEIHARSFVARVSGSDIASGMETMSSLDRAATYAANGIWHDALNTLVSSYREDSQMVTLLEIRRLLDQANTQVPLELSLAIES